MTHPEGDPFAIALVSEVFAAEVKLRSLLTQALPKGLELSQFMVLNHLATVGRERSPAEIAKTFGVTRAAMTNTLGKLDAMGYIHIRPDWEDGRRKWVALSDAGSQQRETAVRALSPQFESLAQALGPDRLREVLPVLRDLRAVLP
ncbi:MAG: MarR family transcriptional regulator [Pseudomonadota bacterium]